jgi:DNA adenine methylase Dam
MFVDLFNDIVDISSPLNYTGSKFKLLPQIRKHLPSNIKELSFYDIFAGGGSVFINMDAKTIYANDIIAPLIEFYKRLQNTELEALLLQIEFRNIPKDSQEQYLLLREKFNQTGDCIDFFLLVCSCTNNMMRFNKSFKFNQTWGKRHFNPNTRNKLEDYHKRLFGNKKFVFSCKSFVDLEIEDNAFVYLDPPYRLSEAGYNAYWSKELEEKLYDFIDSLNSRGIKFMLSNVAEHKGIKNPQEKRLEKYKISELVFDYNKVSRSGNSQTKEILVTNY